MDRQHRPCVLHDPMFIHVWCVVIARSAEKRKEGICRISHNITEFTGIKELTSDPSSPYPVSDMVSNNTLQQAGRNAIVAML